MVWTKYLLNSDNLSKSHILEFAQQYYDHGFILTCRTRTTEYILPTFEPVEVADVNLEQVEAFTGELV